MIIERKTSLADFKINFEIDNIGDGYIISAWIIGIDWVDFDQNVKGTHDIPIAFFFIRDDGVLKISWDTTGRDKSYKNIPLDLIEYDKKMKEIFKEEIYKIIKEHPNLEKELKDSLKSEK